MRSYRWYYAPESSGSGARSPGGPGVTSPSSDAASSPRASDEADASPAPETGYSPEAIAVEDAAALAAESADGEGPPAKPVAGAEIVEIDLQALTAKAEKADEYLALAQRTKADFENFRKRAARDAAVAQERGAVKLVMALLPAVDNLERALAHAPAGEDENGAASFVAGVKHVHNDIVNALKRAGIEPYSPEGETFDPTLHEAVAQQPVPGAAPGIVVEVYQSGYRLGENVLRPARVVVAG